METGRLEAVSKKCVEVCVRVRSRTRFAYVIENDERPSQREVFLARTVHLTFQRSKKWVLRIAYFGRERGVSSMFPLYIPFCQINMRDIAKFH